VGTGVLVCVVPKDNSKEEVKYQEVQAQRRGGPWMTQRRSMGRPRRALRPEEATWPRPLTGTRCPLMERPPTAPATLRARWL